MSSPSCFLFNWHPDPPGDLDWYDLDADPDPSSWWVATHNKSQLPIHAAALRPGALAALWRHGDEPAVIGVARILSHPWWNGPDSGTRHYYDPERPEVIGSYLKMLNQSEDLVPGYFVDWRLHLLERRGEPVIRLEALRGDAAWEGKPPVGTRNRQFANPLLLGAARWHTIARRISPELLEEIERPQ